MNTRLITCAIFLIGAPAAHAQDDTICDSPLVMFGPVVSICEAAGLDVPDTELTGAIGGKLSLSGLLTGELQRQVPAGSQPVLAPSFNEWSETSQPVEQPNPCADYPSSFACEYQRIVDDLAAQSAALN